MLNSITAASQTPQDGGEIGHIFFFTVGEDLYPTQSLEKALVNCGLSLEYMPKKIRSADAFRRATKEIETRRPVSSGVAENYIVRDVYSDINTVVRHIVKETVNSRGKRLDYDAQAAVLTLDKTKEEISIQAADPRAAQLAEEAKRLYSVFKNSYNGQAVRYMVHGILKTLAPTPLRPSGGIYFVPASSKEDLDKLVSFCSSFPKAEGYKIPVVDSSENAGMVTKKLKEHLQSSLRECKNALESTDLPKSRAKQILDDIRHVIKGYERYSSIIKKQKDEFDALVDLARDAAVLLLDKTK